jgi:IS30 family transposase
MNYYLSKIMMYHLIRQMDHEGHSITKIAESFGINWRTVKRFLSMTEQEYVYELENGQPRKRSLEPYEGFIKDKLTTFGDTSAAQLHDWLKEHHPGFPLVSQKTVFNFVHFVRNKYNIPKAEAVREYACVPELPYGLQGQVDFGFYNMKTTHGKVKKVQFFTFVLSCSRYKYIRFNDHPFTTETVIDAHEKAFEFIKGLPQEIVYDQDRLFMVSENLGDIILTGEFRPYVKERGFKTWFCRKADPESKGKVENAVKYVKQNFLYNRPFRDLETLNDEAIDWLFRTANALPHGTTKKIPREEYDTERDFLSPWQPLIPQQADYPLHAVRKDNTISWKSNLYSLPLGTYKGSGTQVLVKATLQEIILLDQNKVELCRHALSPLKGQKILQTDHTRDKRLAIAAMMEEFSALMGDKPGALGWVSQIRDHKPRYIRDQIQLLKATVTGLDPGIASATLDYCITHQIISAVDFKAVAEKLKQQMPVAPQAIVVQLNPLSGDVHQKAGTTPQKSDLNDYEALFQ